MKITEEKKTVLKDALNNEDVSKTLKNIIRELLKENEELKEEINILIIPAKRDADYIIWWDNLLERDKKIYKRRMKIGRWKVRLHDIKRIFELKVFFDYISSIYTRSNDILNHYNLNNKKRLNIPNKEVTDLSSVKHLYNLEGLDCRDTNIKNLSGIEKLRNLISLNVSNTNIKNLSGIENLKKLKYLDISNTIIANLSGIEYLYNLEDLDCENTLITDLSLLATLPNLKQLRYSNGIDISCLKDSINEGLKVSIRRKNN